MYSAKTIDSAIEHINFILLKSIKKYIYKYNIAVHTSAYVLSVATFPLFTNGTEKSGLNMFCYTDKFDARHCKLHRVVVLFF